MKIVQAEIATAVELKTTDRVISTIKPRILEEISGQIDKKLEERKELFEPRQEADKGNMEDPEAIWPNKHLPYFEAKQVPTLSDDQTMAFFEPFFSVMGNGLRLLTMVTGYLSDNLTAVMKAKNLRNLLMHYQNDLTTNDPQGRMITETLCHQLVSQWVALINMVAIPGRINKHSIGDITNEILVHLDGEIFPLGNEVVRNLLVLKTMLADPVGVTNMEIIQALTRVLGPSLYNELTTGRSVSKEGQVRDDVGDDFNSWKRLNCNRLPDRCVLDFRLLTDRHKVNNWSDMYSMEARRKGIINITRRLQQLLNRPGKNNHLFSNGAKIP